jgi:uncharacterized protein
MANEKFEMIYLTPVAPEKGGCPEPNPRTVKADGMIIDYDVAVPMRDGIRIFIDVFRPETDGKYPVLLAWGPYGKHGRVKYAFLGNTGINDADFNQ